MKKQNESKMNVVRKRFRMLCRNLKVQWILVSCITIFPVNVLTAVITGMVADFYEEKIIDSYSNQLNIYAESVDAELIYMQNRVMVFLNSENLAILTMGSTTDSVVDVTRFKEQIGNSKIWGTIPGICYVWDREKDIISIFHQQNTYSMNEMQQLEEYLRQKEMGKNNPMGNDTSMEKKTSTGEGINANDDAVLLTQTAFIAKHYNFPYFSFGLMLDVDWILRSFYDSCGEIKGNIYLMDGDGNFLAEYSENGFQSIITEGKMAEEHSMEEIKKDSQSVVLEGAINSGEYHIVQVIERSDIMKTLPMLINVLYFLTGVSFIALPLLCIAGAHMVLQPLTKLCDAMSEVESGNLEYQLSGPTTTIQMDYLFSRFNHMVDELHSLIIVSYEQEIEKLQTDAINMRLQVNQHMLLNFLNTIYSLSQVGKTKQISEFTMLLMKHFRYVLRQNIDLVPLREEMEFVKDYLQIQKIRFPTSFTSVYSVAEEAGDILIPQLLIENFVENTIKHGLVMGSEIEILINIRSEGNKLLISVCDTGNGIPEEILEKLQNGEIIEDHIGKHIGIWNCRRRLKLYYGDTYQLKIVSKVNEGTQIWLEIPFKPLNNKDAAKRIQQIENR